MLRSLRFLYSASAAPRPTGLGTDVIAWPEHTRTPLWLTSTGFTMGFSTSFIPSLLRAAVLLVAAVAPTAALNAPSSVHSASKQSACHGPTRRAILAATQTMLLAPFAVNALTVSEDKATALEPYVYNANTARQLAAAPFGEKAGVRFAGSYSDPNHPGCPRKIRLAGSSVIVTGADEDGKSWKVRGEMYGNKILLDFTPKGGPADVIGKWTGLGIAFPDGNVWTKL